MNIGMTMFYAAGEKKNSKEAQKARDVAYTKGSPENKSEFKQFSYHNAEKPKLEKTSWIDIANDFFKKMVPNDTFDENNDVFKNSFYKDFIEKTQDVFVPQVEKTTPIYFSQLDKRWASEPYNSDYYDIGKSGCGITSMAMIISSLTSQNVTPLEMAEYSKDIGTAKGGTDISFFSKAAEKYGLKATESYWVYEYYADKVISDLNSGSMYIANLNLGSIWSGGHIVVITEYQQTEDGGWFVAYDPNYDQGKDYYKNNVAIDENIEGKIYIPEEVLKEDWGYLIGISANNEGKQ